MGMQKDIHDDDRDTVTITTEQTFRPGKLEIAVCDGQTSSWYGNRAQLRALIEALRQADAETRTDHEIIVRREQGVTEAFGLFPGLVEEANLGDMNQPGRDPANRAHVEAWAREYVAVRQWYGATVYLSGFPDESTEG